MCTRNTNDVDKFITQPLQVIVIHPSMDTVDVALFDDKSST